MEMVIEGIKNKEKIYDDEPKEIEEWKGVEIEDGQVVEIAWRQFKLEGSLHLEWLPSSVMEFDATGNYITGTLDWASLPTSMKSISLGCNAFTGSIDLGRLPESMKSLNVHYNQLSGSLKLGNLPDTLTEFYAIGNEFSGSVDLTRLPAALSWLNLSQNQLSADPTKGHLSVVGWTSTPVLGEAKNLFKPLVVFLSWRRPY
ncbi:hypothetical protein XU18_3717 [Perkinsela sp. CCAP 1560/4]|nr:hypothetical protein XU18_3717 [Perkinsela sp. CCAP 1560/4]|eukprot:KNH05233.1 hypothetical protein XU18_3717 [Perkinsela sp. CCAP 1560/4]